MKRFAIFLCLALSSLVSADDKVPSKQASDKYRQTIALAKDLSVHEGLPHQAWDHELLEKEIKRKDTTKIWLFPFYTPSVPATNAADLKKVLGSADSILVYGGPKRCGGYHPDYAVSWEADGKSFYALVCFGCHEIVFFDGKTSLMYDLNNVAFDRLQTLLAVYAKKRPHKAK